MSGHTPGPWHWIIHDSSMATLGVGRDPGMGDPHVLSMGPCKACADRNAEWKWGACMTPSEADARLIASAPEMLDDLCKLYDHGYTNCNDHDLVRSVIFKATGEEPA